MNKSELVRRPEIEGFNKTIFSLNGDCSFEGYCLDFSHGEWRVYYFERGTMYGEDYLSNEQDACESFYSRISRDPIVRS